MPTPTHIFFDASATLIYPFPNFDEFCVQFLEEKNVPVNRNAMTKANQAADHVINQHKKKVSIIPNNPVSERIVWSHYQSVRLQHLAADTAEHPWLEWGYEVYDSFNPSDKWRAYDDVIETLTTLKEQGYSLAIVSDFGPGLEKILELIGIADYFDHKFVSTVEGVSKAHSQLFERALQRLGIDPENSIMIGDNHEMDVLNALNVGIPAIWLNRDNKPLPTEFDEKSKVITTLSQIPNLLKTR